MAQFLLVYHGGTMPATPEGQAASMQEWRDWMGAVGAALVVPGAPVGKSWTIDLKGAREGGGANPVSGYSVLEAVDLQAALELAKGCPQASDPSGSIEVAEMMQM